jgi:hypothetical protein
MAHPVVLEIRSGVAGRGVTFVDVTLNHDTADETFSIRKLCSNISCNDRLVSMVFL